MKVVSRLPTNHDDFISDLSYDFYGKRLATCSADQTLKIFDQTSAGDWKLVTEIKAHSGVVNKVAWAHPEFGQIVASCASDRIVQIFQEVVDSETNRASWTNVSHLVDARDTVVGIAFAPRHMGLKLSACCADGFVRIYEAIDIMNLSNWSLADEFEADKKDITAISWNMSPFDPSSLALSSGSIVKIWQFFDKTRRWNAVAELLGHEDLVHDVAWAPNLGRSYHLIATASKDHHVRIFKVITTSNGKYEVTLVADHATHQAEVWRVSWNMTGTILASTGDDGTVRLFKADFSGTWNPHCIIAADNQKLNDNKSDKMQI